MFSLHLYRLAHVWAQEELFRSRSDTTMKEEIILVALESNGKRGARGLHNRHYFLAPPVSS
jgi:hypothetical protein